MSRPPETLRLADVSAARRKDRDNRTMSGSPEPVVETIVMKFGGSSVADPEQDPACRGAARRGARSRGPCRGNGLGHGRATDGLLELARQVSPDPHPRELDMLLSTGERIACALVAMAVHDLGYEAVSFTGSQAGIMTDPVHTKAKIREITPVSRGRVRSTAGRIVLVAGFRASRATRWT